MITVSPTLGFREAWPTLKYLGLLRLNIDLLPPNLKLKPERPLSYGRMLCQILVAKSDGLLHTLDTLRKGFFLSLPHTSTLLVLRHCKSHANLLDHRRCAYPSSEYVEVRR